jgi:hypothetical protein
MSTFGCCLPTPTLPYKAQRLTLVDEEADAINSPNLAYDPFEEPFLNRKVLLQAVSFQDYRFIIGRFSHRSCRNELDIDETY